MLRLLRPALCNVLGNTQYSILTRHNTSTRQPGIAQCTLNKIHRVASSETQVSMIASAARSNDYNCLSLSANRRP